MHVALRDLQDTEVSLCALRVVSEPLGPSQYSSPFVDCLVNDALQTSAD